MPNTLLSAREIYDTAPLGSRLQFSDGTPEPPARHRRKRTAWLSNNGAARLVRKKPADHLSGPSFTLHVGSFGSGEIAVVDAYRTITTASTLSYAILERPRPGQAAVLQDESGIPSLLYLKHALVLVAYVVLLPFSRWQSRGKLRSSPDCSSALVTTWSG